ncbi:DUF1056 family protein [Sporolactobacillus putidus]|uniref:Uncharacterized protein n=1 Tax=Sporolactobacillus putidus TaxID=492735 RepID=A0A917S3Y1_9BACL|nr:hypothetical protein GCM10007968_19950 [Sporolactobacillus putidus]
MAIKLNLNSPIKFIWNNIHSILFLLGLGILVFTVFLINTIAGLFTLSGVLILLGLLINNIPTGGR